MNTSRVRRLFSWSSTTFGHTSTTFQVARYTNAQQVFPDSGLGDEWDSTLTQRVRESGGQATLYLGDSDPATHTSDGSGNYGRGDFYALAKDGSGNFVLTYDNGLKIHFNSHGNVAKRVLRAGKEYVWHYDNTTIDQRVQSVSVQMPGDSSPTTIVNVTWTTSSPYRITDISAPLAGDTIVYQYDASDRITKASGSCGSCGGSESGAIYTYVASGVFGAGAIETVSNLESQRKIKNVYDSSSRVLTQFLSDDTGYGTFSYEDYGQGIYAFTGYEGAEQVIYLDTNNRVTRNVLREGGTDYKVFEKIHDGNGNITRQKYLMARPGGINKWREESFTYTSNGQLSLAMKHDIANGVTSTIITHQYFRDPTFNNATKIINADGVATVYQYNAAGLQTKSIFDPTGLNQTRVKLYDGNGWVTREIDPAGVATDYAYSSRGHLLTLTQDPAGLAIQTVYYPDDAGRVTRLVEPGGITHQTFYGSGNQVTKRIDPAGATTVYLHDAAGRLTKEQTTAGSLTLVSTHEYDAWGNRIASTDPAGATTTHEYDLNNELTSIEDATGVKRGMQYNPRGDVTAELIRDIVNGQTQWVTQMTYLYDMDGHVTRQTDALGNDLMKSAQYDGYGQLTRQTDALDNYVALQHDASGRVTRSVNYDAADMAVAEMWSAYDAAGRQTEQRQLASPGGATGNADALVQFAYDVVGQVTLRTRHIDATRTTQSRTFYDSVGRMTREEQDDAAAVAMYYDSAHLLSQVVDPLGLNLATAYAYDTAGRLVTQTEPDATYTVTLYDGLGRVTKSQSHDSTDNRYAVMELEHDLTGRVTKSWQYAAPATQVTHNATTDPNQSRLYDLVGRVTATIDTLGNQSSYAYDGRGRQVTTTDPLGNRQVVIYDNADRAITQVQIDENGVTDVEFRTAMLYNALGRLTASVSQGPDGDMAATADNLTSSVWYSALGRVTLQQDPAGVQIKTLYDGLGRVTRQIEDVTGIARNTDSLYDRLGQVVTLTAYTANSGGVTERTLYAYDDAGRQTRVTYPDDTALGGDGRGYVTYIYDLAGRLTRINHQDNLDTDFVYDQMGRRLTVLKGSEIDSFTYTVWGDVATAQRGTSANPDLVSQVSRSYDALMRLTRESQSIREGSARHVDYAYDKAANVLTLTHPSGTTIATSYDALGRGDVLKRDGNPIADYDYMGHRLKTLTFEAGTDDVQLTQTFDGVGRLTRMTYAQAGNTGLPDFSYGFDAASNITEKVFEHRSGTPAEDYGYDTLHRLTRTTFGQRTSDPYEGFVYDHLGNHLVQDDNGTTVAGEFNAVNEQTKRGTTALSHDLRGNLTADDASGGREYFYDRQNLLTRVEDGTSTRIASYAYDALGRRIEKDVQGGAVTEFYWHGQQLVEETNATGTVQRKYVWSPSPGRGGYIDDLVQFIDRTGGSDVAYFACRHHNFNIVALLSSSGGVVERYDYNPYGKRSVLDSDYSDDADGLSDVAFQVGHQGLMHDGESELVYNRARMLHVVLGRFMHRDPLGYIDGRNFYQYQVSSPIDRTDSRGTSSKSEYRCCSRWERGYKLIPYPSATSCAATILVGNNPYPAAGAGVAIAVLAILKNNKVVRVVTVGGTFVVTAIAWENAMVKCNKWYCQSKYVPHCCATKAGMFGSTWECECKPDDDRVAKKGVATAPGWVSFGGALPHPSTTGGAKWTEHW